MTTQPASSYTCVYCRQSGPLASDQLTCSRCGAPVELASVASKSGWITLPGARDLARIQFNRSSAQVSGTAVPVCDVTLGDGDAIVFFHSELLWTSQARLDAVRANASFSSRLLGGVPRLMMSASGPGNVALSADWAGELVIVPLESNQGITATQHHLMLTTANVAISTVDTGIFISRDDKDRQGDVVNRYVNQLVASNGPALVVLHAPGNVVVRDLAPGEQIFVQPASIVYTDVSVSRQLFRQGGSSSVFSANPGAIFLTALTGPGRIALTSVYEHVPRMPGATSLRGFSNRPQMGGGILGAALGGALDGALGDFS